jgi:hypothetical protein
MMLIAAMALHRRASIIPLTLAYRVYTSRRASTPQSASTCAGPRWRLAEPTS